MPVAAMGAWFPVTPDLRLARPFSGNQLFQGLNLMFTTSCPDFLHFDLARVHTKLPSRGGFVIQVSKCAGFKMYEVSCVAAVSSRSDSSELPGKAGSSTCGSRRCGLLWSWAQRRLCREVVLVLILEVARRECDLEALQAPQLKIPRRPDILTELQRPVNRPCCPCFC